jgi:hypothetical protein
MITATARIAAIEFTTHNPAVFWSGALMTVFFALSEMYYIDIQEDAIARSRELAKLLERLLKFGLKSEHEAYEFGLGKVFGGGHTLKLENVRSWLLYRTFNPFLYGGVLGLIIIAAIAVTISSK